MNFEPTTYPPGSVEKIQVLRQRAELGLPLWHRDDKQDYTGELGALIVHSHRKQARPGKVVKTVFTGRKSLCE